MRKIFARTQNVKNFINMMNNLKNRADGVPGMALVYGEPGLGKTQAVIKKRFGRLTTLTFTPFF
ncbi:MAG: hypothetical protein WCG95_08905, partial [bacterium]